MLLSDLYRLANMLLPSNKTLVGMTSTAIIRLAANCTFKVLLACLFFLFHLGELKQEAIIHSCKALVFQQQ